MLMPQKRHGLSRAFFPSINFRQSIPDLFFFVFFLHRLYAAVVLGLGFGVFHGFAGFGGLFGAGFGALFALFVEHLFAAQQFEESFVGAVAFVPAGADHAGVGAVAVAEA